MDEYVEATMTIRVRVDVPGVALAALDLDDLRRTLPKEVAQSLIDVECEVACCRPDDRNAYVIIRTDKATVDRVVIGPAGDTAADEIRHHGAY
jgi:hypothetical protein